jgi:hypothetical protein
MYGTQAETGVKLDVAPVAPQIVSNLEENLAKMNSYLNAIETKCHNILNLRTPVAEEKQPTPMEQDFAQQMGNRLSHFSRLNERLAEIERHLIKIIG